MTPNLMGTRPMRSPHCKPTRQARQWHALSHTVRDAASTSVVQCRGDTNADQNNARAIGGEPVAVQTALLFDGANSWLLKLKHS